MVEKVDDFNLFVSVSREAEKSAIKELKSLLQELGDEKPFINRTIARGILTAKTRLNPLQCLKEIKKMISKDDFKYQFLLKIVPIERVVSTSLQEIQKTCKQLVDKKIKAEEKFRITLERRFAKLSRDDVIKAAATDIDREVDLKDPDKIVYIQLLGDKCFISVINPEDVLSILKELEEARAKKFEEQLGYLSKKTKNV